jgi:catechol 2,3-dioxygenase-like lactoylglutathione lyase family enzyme
MIGVSDMNQSVDFYKNKFGLPLEFQSDEWSEFRTGETKLALHRAKKREQVSEGSNSREIRAGSCSIGFYVQDIDVTCNKLKEAGVSFVMSPTLREGEGIKLAICRDPDGLEISIAQSSR